MSKFFLSYCIKPVYLQSSEQDAKKCGLINGSIYASLLTLIIVLLGGRFYLREKNYDDKKFILKCLIGVIIAIWIFVPVISYKGRGVEWNGYQNLIQELIDQGFTRQQALGFIQGISETSIQPGVVGNLSTMIFASDSKQKTNDSTKSNRRLQSKKGEITNILMKQT